MRFTEAAISSPAVNISWLPRSHQMEGISNGMWNFKLGLARDTPSAL
jgi:hypothetical protein